MPDRESNSVASKIRRLNKVKLFLNLTVILIACLACYVEDVFLYFQPSLPGETALLTFRSPSSFNFDQGQAFKGLRDTAIAQHIPIYAYLPDRVTATRKKMESFIKEVLQSRSQGKEGRKSLIDYLKKEYGIDLSYPQGLRLLKYPDLQNLLTGILTAQQSISQDKIVEDPKHLHGKQTIRVSYSGAFINAFSVQEITTLETARKVLADQVHQLFWQVDANILDPLLQVSLATLQPNLRYDRKQNDLEFDKIAQEYPSQILTYKAGEVLVPFRKVLNKKDVLLLAASRKAEEKDPSYSPLWLLFTVCFSVLLYNFLLSKVYSPYWRIEPPYRLFLIALILVIVLSKACLVFTTFPVYTIPFAILPIMLVLLHREKTSLTFTAVLGAILISLFAGRNLVILLFLTFGGLVAILTSFRLHKRSHIFFPSLMVGLTNAVMVLILSAGISGLGPASWQANLGWPVFGLMGWAFLGGLAAGPLVLLILPLLEMSWHYASTFKLNKFADLQNPLMVELLTKAPGTYQHAMTVAHLAYTLGEAIGANSLLLRVAAYYHDIGKTANPDFYVENLFGRKTPHDDLPARESARIIMDHVREGKKIALEAGVPEVVADFIPQHHGTLLIEYFYDKAVKENPKAVISQKDFRYSGPKPQSVEAAILMIVDAVEATSRTIEEPTREKIEGVIRHIIENRIADGQFDECNLSTSEIAKIITVLVRSLEAAFHTRVEYPWQHQEKNEEKMAQSHKKPA